jgi:predicted nucleotidyltransferase
MICLSIEVSYIKNKLKNNLESIVLFGSYARLEQKKDSDIDILIITKKKISENKFEKDIQKINNKISLLVFTKEEFREKILNFNHQLITFFMDGKILYDSNKYYYKMESLFLALNRKKDFKLRYKKKVITLEQLRIKKNFI